MRPPDPEMRNPAAANGRVKQKAKPGRLKKEAYADREIVSRVAVYNGRLPVGQTLPTHDGCHLSVAADGEPIRFFRSQIETRRSLNNKGDHSGLAR
jgi:hypothetical protein